MLLLSLNINRCGTCVSCLLHLYRQRLNDICKYALTLNLFKDLVFVDSCKSGIFSDCLSKLVEKLGFLKVLGDS